MHAHLTSFILYERGINAHVALTQGEYFVHSEDGKHKIMLGIQFVILVFFIFYHHFFQREALCVGIKQQLMRF